MDESQLPGSLYQGSISGYPGALHLFPDLDLTGHDEKIRLIPDLVRKQVCVDLPGFLRNYKNTKHYISSNTAGLLTDQLLQDTADIRSAIRSAAGS